MALDSTGVLYVANALLTKIERFSRDGELLGEISSPDSVARAWPLGIAVESDGNLLVTASGTDVFFGYGQVQRLSPDGTLLQRWGDEGPVSERLGFPLGIAVAGDGFIYVTDNSEHEIVKFAHDGTFVASWRAGLPEDGRSHWGPQSLVITPGRTIVMTEWHGSQVFEFSLEGDSLAQWGTNGVGEGEMHNTYGIAVDARGDVYVGDLSYPRIMKFTSRGEFLTQRAEPFDIEGGILFPDQMAIYKSKELYVLDPFRRKILRFAL